ncbi:MAG: NPCBM/NEW2 domain-containing protein [Acidobacteriota bacterium]
MPQARLYSDAATVLTTPVYLSELTPTVSISGWGPYEKDRSNGESRARDGQTLSLGNVKWGRGLGVHPASDLRYQLAGKYQTLLCRTWRRRRSE